MLFRVVCIVTIILANSVIINCNLDLNEESAQFCEKPVEGSPGSDCHLKSKALKSPRYILYDVNPPEGFNLRRDVYMRMAVFASKLPKSEDWHLVLPPWNKLYHWKTTSVGEQMQLAWENFFDIPSLQKFAPVVEMFEFFKDYGQMTIQQVYVLQHYKDAFENNKWEEKFDVEPCQEKIPYRLEANGSYSGWFWGYRNITAERVSCLSFHGLASQLKEVAADFSSVMFDHAEVALHDHFGDRSYWEARRSMKFAKHLVRLANEFREQFLHSTDVEDATQRPEDWTLETAHRNAKGGNYICAHLRRQDFLWGRPKDVPSISAAAQQLKYHLNRLKLDTLFIATDATTEEINELRSLLPEYRALCYEANNTVRHANKDGGIAIIEQIICSHARYFIGTHESTFSFRIQEEREILGFPVESTFNRMCEDNKTTCKPPSQWKIVF